MASRLGPIALIVALAVLVTLPGTASAWNFPAHHCGWDGNVYGIIDFPPHSQPFKVFLQDHVPGQTAYARVAGSEETINPHPNQSWAHTGRLSTEHVRDGADFIRIANSFDSNTSAPFRPCKASPSLHTNPSAGGEVGVTLNDTAKLTGGKDPTGSITFKLFPPNDPRCSGRPVYKQTDETTPYTTSPGFVSNAAGVWHWTADYSGDAHNHSAHSDCDDERVMVGKATKGQPVLTTVPSAGGAMGVMLNDTAKLTGGKGPTGPVTFKLFPPSDASCSGQPAFTHMASGAPYGTSPGFVSNAEGTWHWTADYSGDAQNNPAHGGCKDEPVTVGSTTQGQPTLTTTPSTGGQVGVTLNDTATLTGGKNPTGAVTFRLFAPTDPGCTGSPVFFQIDSSAPYGTGPGYVSNVAGTWHWTAEYAGDANNKPAKSDCSDEPVQVTAVVKASPALSTTPSAGGEVGLVTLNDTASLSGGNNPLGAVTFNLFAPNDANCTGQPAFTHVASSAPYNAGPGFLASGAGTWHWTADYAGDTNNNDAHSLCAAEPVVVDKASVHVDTNATIGPVSVGTPINDIAHLSGGFGLLTGTISFDVSLPSDSGCSTPIPVIPARTVNGGGDYTSADYIPMAPGMFYRWAAHYSGDANNKPFDTNCRDAFESSLVF